VLVEVFEGLDVDETFPDVEVEVDAGLPDEDEDDDDLLDDDPATTLISAHVV